MLYGNRAARGHPLPAVRVLCRGHRDRKAGTKSPAGAALAKHALELVDVAVIGDAAGRVLMKGKSAALCQEWDERDEDRLVDLAGLARLPAHHLSPASHSRAMFLAELARLEGDDEEESAAA